MKTQRRIRLVAGVVSPIILFISLLPISPVGMGWTTAAIVPDGQQSYEFTNKENADAEDLHIEWRRAVRIVQVTHFRSNKGTGTGKTDFSNGVVPKGQTATITVAFDGDKDAEVEKWWWTVKVGDESKQLGPIKYGNPTAPVPPSSTNGDGLQVITFTTNPGTITVNLPNDMRAGDTISGTVVAEPKGETKEEKTKNLGVLTGYVIALNPVVPAPQGSTISDVTFVVNTNLNVPTPITFNVPAKPNLGLYLMPNVNSSVVRGPKGGLTCINEGCSPISQLVFTQPTPEPITITTNETPPTIFTVPILGQTGKPIEITGPFDGNSSNTDVDFQPLPPANPNAPSQPPGAPYHVIAESPRKAIVTNTTNLTGPLEVTVDEGGKKTTSPHRSVGVNLTAPKTSLLKGEQTTLKVEVTGLEGITAPVPLTLTCTGVITMEGGVYQPLVIQPSEVGAGGRYTTTRGITGVQAGGWGATATVVTRRFNVCLQDDTVPNRRILWNTVNGEYVFVSPFPPKPPGQTPQTGSTTPPPLTGTGKMVMKGCIITLSHNAPDRRVFSRLDSCTNTGNAKVETVSPKSNFTITDRNTTDNTCGSQ